MATTELKEKVTKLLNKKNLAGFLMEWDISAKLTFSDEMINLELEAFGSFETSMLEELSELTDTPIGEFEIIPVKRIDPDEEQEETITTANIIYACFTERFFEIQETEMATKLSE